MNIKNRLNLLSTGVKNFLNKTKILYRKAELNKNTPKELLEHIEHIRQTLEKYQKHGSSAGNIKYYIGEIQNLLNKVRDYKRIAEVRWGKNSKTLDKLIEYEIALEVLKYGFRALEKY